MPVFLRPTRLLAVAVLAVSSGAAAQQATPPTTTIATGTIVGNRDGALATYKGIPYAAAPVGALRWRAPQPAAPWRGIRAATHYGADCMQKPFPSDAAPLGTTPAEDCLYANVWTPAKPGERLPVMVWIYGGGFVNGGASPPTYSGAALATKGIVVASFNYRLGRFGTFAHPQLRAADADQGLLANYGFMDQIAALRWVRDNIAAFGGDPDRVTIVGESAGGRSVHTLISSPLARGLFTQAVIQSGGDGNALPGTLASASREGLSFAAANGIAADAPDALARLRALPASTITGDLNLASLFAPGHGPRTFSTPVTDGRIAVDPTHAYASGAFNTVRVMIGATSDDIGGRNGAMITGARQAAARFARLGLPVWYYRFSHVAKAARTAQTRGAGHATDIPFFFDTAEIKYGADTQPGDRAVAARASNYLVNFVKRGDPNAAGLPAWPRYTPATQAMLDFGQDAALSSGRDPWAD